MRVFDAQSVIYQHVVPPKTKNAVYYVQVLKSLQKHINKKRLAIARLWILHQDKARPHIATIVCDFLEKGEILDLTPCNFWLFPSLKKALWGRQLSSNQEVVTMSPTFFNSLLQVDFKKTIMTK